LDDKKELENKIEMLQAKKEDLEESLLKKTEMLEKRE
jgi:hypothetical protein